MKIQSLVALAMLSCNFTAQVAEPVRLIDFGDEEISQRLAPGEKEAGQARFYGADYSFFGR